jgi:hypothetical protein
LVDGYSIICAVEASNLGAAMLSNLRGAMRWVFSLGRRLISVVPVLTLYSVAATLVSQLALLLAFVLPLKVILLLGSEGIPRYFPEQFRAFDRESLILALSALALVLYVVHLFAERLIGVCVAGGSRKLLLRSRKMVWLQRPISASPAGWLAWCFSLCLCPCSFGLARIWLRRSWCTCCLLSRVACWWLG